MTKHVSQIILLAAGAGLAVILSGCNTSPISGGTDLNARRAGIPQIIEQPLDVHAKNTETDVKIEVVAVGDQLTYQWFRLEVSSNCPDVTSEVLLPGQTNSILQFTRVEPDDYGLYFCEIISHPPPDEPLFVVGGETRTRLMSLDGPAIHIVRGESILTPPQQGTVKGPGIPNPGIPCLPGSAATYVTFVGSGSGYAPEPATAVNCFLTLTNVTTGICFKNTDYTVGYNDSTYPSDFGCFVKDNPNRYQYDHGFSVVTPPRSFLFTIVFTGNQPPAGTKVTMGLRWQ
jgi:hypothetical protein